MITRIYTIAVWLTVALASGAVPISAATGSAASLWSSSIHFTRISIDQGLSQSTVFSITQDRYGNMWFATYDGVNKYDGYEFKVYQHVIDDDTSLADDIARVACTDLEGRIWIGTNSGLSLYDEELDIFRNYFYRDNPQPCK